MNVHVTFFARARDLAGTADAVVELADRADRVGDLRQCLGARFPALAPLLPHLLVAIGNDYARDDSRLFPEARVACFPPVSGG